MKFISTFSLLFLLTYFISNAQTVLRYEKEPQWNIIKSYDSRYGSTLQLEDDKVAMIVNTSKSDFAVVTIGDQLDQKWITEFSGFPMAIGRFKENILVIAATDRSYFKSFTNTFIGYLIDQKTGKLIATKTLYDGSKDFMEEPQFFFSKDGSYFKMSVRTTAMKKKIHVGLPIVGFLTVLKVEKDYATTTAYEFIDFDNQLVQSQRTSPIMPPGQTWEAACGEDGSFIIITKDSYVGKFNFATYLSGKREPLKSVSVPIDIFRGSNDGGMLVASSKTPLVNYFAMMYKNISKEQCLIVLKIDFAKGTFLLNQEIFDKSHIKELQKSFIPVNKKFDNLDFSNPRMMDVRSINEYDDKLLVTVSPGYIISSPNYSYRMEESVLINAYNQQIKPIYHQFIPRIYLSLLGEGNDIAYNQKGNVLRMVANQKDGGTGVDAIYAEMDLNTGKMLKINELSKDHIKNSYYASTSTLWWQKNSFTIQFIQKPGGFAKKLDVQLLQLSY
jgi:hypothetical protein